MSHETFRPVHEILEKQRSGEYKQGFLGTASGYQGQILTSPDGTPLSADPEDSTYITEYHGKIPEKFIEEDDDSPFLEFELEREGNKEDDSIEGEEMVEAIVTIGNGIVLLKAKRNPFLNGDRGFVAYPHDIIPNAFWGRGVCDKGFNAQ